MHTVDSFPNTHIIRHNIKVQKIHAKYLKQFVILKTRLVEYTGLRTNEQYHKWKKKSYTYIRRELTCVRDVV